MHLFIEVFPIETPPILTAYQLQPAAAGRALTARLRKQLSGNWVWQAPHHILTDSDALPFEVAAIAEAFATESQQAFALTPDFTWQPTPQRLSDFVIRTHLHALKSDLEAALVPFNAALDATVLVERDYKAVAWEVEGIPAVSLSVASRLVYAHTLEDFLQHQNDLQALIGLRVIEPASNQSGEIVKFTGTVGERRDLILQALRNKEALYQHAMQTPDHGYAVRVQMGNKRLEYPASALKVMIRPADFALFGIDEKLATPILRPDPATRSLMIKALSDVAKGAGILGRALSAREYPTAFEVREFAPYLRFSGGRSRPYNPPALSLDFIQCGAFHLRDQFAQAPIRVCVVNALSMKIEDFVEALQRALSRSFDFDIDVIRERRVRVVSLENLESAVRVVEKEQPDLILAFMPDVHEIDDLPEYVKSLTLGRGIPTHVLAQSTLDDPDAMPAIIMAILAKTGNTPFALADPLEKIDYVVGLALVEETRNDEAIVTAIARIYRADGAFVRYVVRRVALQDGMLPYVLMRDLFPQRDFAKRRVIVHHDGTLSDKTRQALLVWGQAIQAAFYAVEVLRRGAPRLYAFAENRVQAPPWGSFFRLNLYEGFLVLKDAPTPSNGRRAPQSHTPTPQPLHVISHELPLEQAVQSLQLWTLLYYGVTETPSLPVTLYNAGELAYWLRKGGSFNAPEGEVPFWL